jgi:hypothetical protein
MAVSKKVKLKMPFLFHVFGDDLAQRSAGLCG